MCVRAVVVGQYLSVRYHAVPQAERAEVLHVEEAGEVSIEVYYRIDPQHIQGIPEVGELPQVGLLAVQGDRSPVQIGVGIQLQRLHPEEHYLT